MATTPFTTNPNVHGSQNQQRIAQVVDVKNDKDFDGKPRFRVKVRVYGDQKNEMLIPDENLQWVRVEVDPTSKGGSPLLLPGMMVRVNDMGGSPGGQGMGPYVGSIVSYSPNFPENGEGNKVASKTAEPREESDTYPYDKYQDPDPIKNTTTMASAAQDCWYQARDEDPKQKAQRKKNRHEQPGTKFA